MLTLALTPMQHPHIRFLPEPTFLHCTQLCRCHGLSLPAGRVYQRALLRMRDLLTGGVGKRGPPNVGSDYQALKWAYFTKA